jgi:predicted TIM-barrel fold metal-dependent hydrolase
MIVDIHTHTFPDDLAARAVAALSARAGIPAHSDGTCAGLRASLTRAGIDRAVMQPVATKPTQVAAINTWAIAHHDPVNGLACFGVLHPADDAWPAEIERLAAAGVPGIKLHPDYQGFFVDEPRLRPLFRALADAGLIVLFHAGVDIGLPPPVHCPPERLARLLDAVPHLTVIAAHMGGYQQWDDVARHLAGRDLYLDTGYTQDDLPPAALVDLIRAHGAARVLYGTDSPWRDQAADLARFRTLPLTPDEQTAILGENAQRLLGW